MEADALAAREQLAAEAAAAPPLRDQLLSSVADRASQQLTENVREQLAALVEPPVDLSTLRVSNPTHETNALLAAVQTTMTTSLNQQKADARWTRINTVGVLVSVATAVAALVVALTH